MKLTRRVFLATVAAAPLVRSAEISKMHTLWEGSARPGLVLRNGPNGIDRRPKGPFRFVEEDLGGSNPKIKLTDSNGLEWIAKWSEEVHSETFASRLAASAGYFVRTAYFVPRGQIAGCEGLQRAKDHIDSEGRFESAVFKLIPTDEPYLAGNNWAWVNNPFLDSSEGVKQLNGLKMMLMLTSNWDAKDTRNVDAGPNTAIYELAGTNHVEYRYAFDDWGGSMGRWGGVIGRTKWDPEGFEKQSPEFVKGLDGDGFVKWGYSGTNGADVTEGVSPSDVAWLLSRIGSLEDQDLQAGLKDAGADDEESTVFVRSLRSRINQMRKIADG